MPDESGSTKSDDFFFSYHLVRTYFAGDPDEPPPPVGGSHAFDDFQVTFHPEERMLQISLTGQDVELLKRWGWPKNEKRANSRP